MRISTKEERALQRYDRQEKSLETYAKNNNIEYLLSFKDDYSGATFNRPNWLKLEQLLQEGDTIVFKDISRFTRQADEGYAKYMELMDKGVNLVFLDNPTVSTEYIKNMMGIAEQQGKITKKALQNTVELLLIVELDRVEQERETFSKRVRDGIAASPKKSGRPKGTLDKMSDELRKDIERYLRDRKVKLVDLMNKHKLSRNTLKKYIQLVEEEKKQMPGQMKLI